MPNAMARLTRGARWLFSAESVRWLLSAERLPGPPADAVCSTAQRPGLYHWLMTTPPLEDEQPPRKTGGVRRGPAPVVATLDELPVSPRRPLGATRRRVGILGPVLGREELPGCGGPDITRNRAEGFLQWVASAEVCVEEPLPPEQPRRGVLGWLLAGEEL